jgi:hypothetical protein
VINHMTRRMRMLKIDTHAHYLPRDWPDLAAKYGDARFPVIHHGDEAAIASTRTASSSARSGQDLGSADPHRRLRPVWRAGAGAEHGAGDVQRMGQAAPGTGTAQVAQ